MAWVISTGGAERAEETFCEKGHFGAQSEKTPVQAGPLSSASKQLARGHSARSLATPLPPTHRRPQPTDSDRALGHLTQRKQNPVSKSNCCYGNLASGAPWLPLGV